MVAPVSKITAYLNNWSYKVTPSSLGSEEKEQKKAADILADVLKTGSRQSSMGKKDGNFNFRFSIVGDPEEVMGKAEKIVSGFAEMVTYTPSAGTAYAVVIFDDGSSQTIHQKTGGKMDVDEAGVKLMETVYNDLNEQVDIDREMADMAKQQQQQSAETEGLEMGQEGLSL